MPLAFFRLSFSPVTVPLTAEFAGRVARFGITSALSAAVSVGLPVVLHEFFAIPVRAAVAAGFLLSYVANFILLRSFVYRSSTSARRDAPRYLLTNGILRLVEYGAFLVLHEAIGVNYAVSVTLVLFASTVVKFFAYQRVFGTERRHG